jgi:hypothetical protein
MVAAAGLSSCIASAISRLIPFPPTGSLILRFTRASCFIPTTRKEGTDGLGGVARTANNLPHIIGVDIEREKHTHFVNGAVDVYTIWIIDKGFYEHLQELLIFVCIHTRVGLTELVGVRNFERAPVMIRESQGVVNAPVVIEKPGNVDLSSSSFLNLWCLLWENVTLLSVNYLFGNEEIVDST